MNPSLLAAAACAALCLVPLTGAQDPAPDPGGADEVGPRSPLQEELERAFRDQGLRLDLEAGFCSIPVEVCIREDLLEYLVVAEYGASRESLFSTKVTPSIWNTALVALGAEPSRGARFTQKDPVPSDEELAAGASPYDVQLPEGTPFYFYALWTEDGETRLHRLEDLVGNLKTGRSMRRHPLRYVGSHMVQPDPEDPTEVFVADLEGNLVNVHYFQADKAIMSTAVEDGVYDTIWIANAWLVPERGTPVQLIASREPLTELPAALRDVAGE